MRAQSAAPGKLGGRPGSSGYDGGGAERLLARLEGVQQCGPDRWRAICPAHESRHRTRSLAVRELPDGTLLVRCHAGCDVGAVVGAVGLKLKDLFPRDHSAPADPRRPQRSRHWHTIREAVQTLHAECLIAAIAAEDAAAGRPMSKEDAERTAIAAQRIRTAIEACT